MLAENSEDWPSPLVATAETGWPAARTTGRTKSIVALPLASVVTWVVPARSCPWLSAGGWERQAGFE